MTRFPFPSFPRSDPGPSRVRGPRFPFPSFPSVVQDPKTGDPAFTEDEAGNKTFYQHRRRFNKGAARGFFFGVREGNVGSSFQQPGSFDDPEALSTHDFRFRAIQRFLKERERQKQNDAIAGGGIAGAQAGLSPSGQSIADLFALAGFSGGPADDQQGGGNTFFAQRGGRFRFRGRRFRLSQEEEDERINTLLIRSGRPDLRDGQSLIETEPRLGGSLRIPPVQVSPLKTDAGLPLPEEEDPGFSTTDDLRRARLRSPEEGPGFSTTNDLIRARNERFRKRLDQSGLTRPEEDERINSLLIRSGQSDLGGSQIETEQEDPIRIAARLRRRLEQLRKEDASSDEFTTSDNLRRGGSRPSFIPEGMLEHDQPTADGGVFIGDGDQIIVGEAGPEVVRVDDQGVEVEPLQTSRAGRRASQRASVAEDVSGRGAPQEALTDDENVANQVHQITEANRLKREARRAEEERVFDRDRAFDEQFLSGAQAAPGAAESFERFERGEVPGFTLVGEDSPPSLRRAVLEENLRRRTTPADLPQVRNVRNDPELAARVEAAQAQIDANRPSPEAAAKSRETRTARLEGIRTGAAALREGIEQAGGFFSEAGREEFDAIQRDPEVTEQVKGRLRAIERNERGRRIRRDNAVRGREQRESAADESREARRLGISRLELRNLKNQERLQNAAIETESLKTISELTKRSDGSRRGLAEALGDEFFLTSIIGISQATQMPIDEILRRAFPDEFGNLQPPGVGAQPIPESRSEREAREREEKETADEIRRSEALSPEEARIEAKKRIEKKVTEQERRNRERIRRGREASARSFNPRPFG